MGKRRVTTKLYLTDRALADIQAIESHSVAEWGRRTANKYLAGIEQALQLLRHNPGLLQSLPEFHADFGFYQSGRHLMVCARCDQSIYVLTLIHANRDIPTRLADLQPQLSTEVALLQQKLADS